MGKISVYETQEEGLRRLWIPSMVNHLWWSALTCEGDPEVLREKQISTIHHVVNRHDWLGNRHYHKCGHGSLDPQQERRNIAGTWFPTHKAMVDIIKDKLLINNIAHQSKYVRTTSLDGISLDVPQIFTQVSHEVMTYGTMLQLTTIRMLIDNRYRVFILYSILCNIS